MRKYLLLLSSLFLLSLSCNLNDERSQKDKKGYREELKSDDGLIGIGMPASINETEYRQALKYMEEGAPEKAIPIYKHLSSIESDSLKTYAYAGLAAAYLASKNYKEAINNYNLSIKYNDKNAFAYIGLGSLYSEQKDYKKAIQYYETALNYNNKNPDAYWGLALVYDELNDLTNAKANAQKFIELVPNSKYKQYADYILAK